MADLQKLDILRAGTEGATIIACRRRRQMSRRLQTREWREQSSRSHQTGYSPATRLDDQRSQSAAHGARHLTHHRVAGRGKRSHIRVERRQPLVDEKNSGARQVVGDLARPRKRALLPTSAQEILERRTSKPCLERAIPAQCDFFAGE